MTLYLVSLWFFHKVQIVTIRPYFPHRRSCISSKMVVINLGGPDLIFEYNPWPKAPTFFRSWKTVPSHAFRQASEVSAKARSKCNPQKYWWAFKCRLLFIPISFDFWQNCATVINEQFINLFLSVPLIRH